MAVTLIFLEESGPHDWPIDGPRLAANEERRAVIKSKGKAIKESEQFRSEF